MAAADGTLVTVQVRVFEPVIRDIARGPDVYDFVRGIVVALAADMRSGAPVRTGAGRASIQSRVEMGPDGWYGTAGWDTPHYYMGILNSRSHFVDPALSRVRFV